MVAVSLRPVRRAHLRAVVDGVTIQSILIVGDEVGTYEMVGYPEVNGRLLAAAWRAGKVGVTHVVG